MKNNYITGILSSIIVMLSLVFLVSCEDDDGASSVELLSFGPSGVQHGDEIVIIGRNLDRVNAVVFSPTVEVQKSSFTQASAGQIKLIVPEAAETGKVILRTPSGDIESKTIFNLEVPVIISAFTEEAKPGTDITITGQFLNWVESITFNEGITVTEFVSKSLTEIVVTVPLTAKTGFLEMSTGGTEPLDITLDQPLVVTLPVVTGFAPASVRHANNVTINGTDLDLVTKIDFPGGATITKDQFVSQALDKIVVTVPVTAIAGALTLTVPSGVEVVSVPSLSITLPNVTAFSPSSTDDHDPGVTLIMTGTDLDLVQKLTFPNVAAAVTAFVSQSPTEIQVVIPDDVQGGTVVITTIHGFAVPIDVPFGDQLTLAKVIFDDGAKNGFGQWGGWGSTTDWANAEQVRIGSTAIKATYPSGNWNGAAQFGGGDLSTAGTAFFAFSVYGGTGTNGKTLQLLVKRTGGEATKQVTIEEGKWTDFKIPLSELGSPANVTELFFQNADFTGTIYIDQIGLK